VYIQILPILVGYHESELKEILILWGYPQQSLIRHVGGIHSRVLSNRLIFPLKGDHKLVIQTALNFGGYSQN
jgi:hypothetical protein